ncbi:MAG TPA: hypothetical protein VGL45_11890 [Bradyrhizobium sp.]
MPSPPTAQDVADALAMTLEREDMSGAPWCPPGDAAALRKWVTDRSASLGTGIRRAVRLARLMAVADGRADYIRFLYERVGSLRARLFRQVLERAAAEGRLPSSFAKLTENGVHLHEAALVPQGTPQDFFEIDFVQMARLAALLDIMHNALGFTTVADLLAPLLPKAGAPKSSADEVARALQAALNAWLSARLESNNHILQAQQIRGFIASRGRLAAETVDDETILLFWIKAAEATEAERIEGFRLYRTVAAAMLRYRHALRDAIAERQLEDALGRGFEPANDSFINEPVDAKGEPWRSPLRTLYKPPASQVKWLTAREQHVLMNYLGGAVDDADDAGEEASAASSEDASWKDGLGGEGRFNLSHWLTLLRADLFGAMQASIVGKLRKRADAATAIAQALQTLDVADYAAAARVYSDLRAQLHVESLAALALLMEAGAPEAVILLRALGGDAVLAEIVGPARRGPALVDDDDDDEDDDDREEDDDTENTVGDIFKAIAPRLTAAIAAPATLADGAARTLLTEAVAARRKVSRAGFRREDRADPAMAVALRAGAHAVFDVIGEIDRLTATLSTKAAAADLAGDTARFAAAFRSIYLGTTK